jgi:hypothetical protein
MDIYIYIYIFISGVLFYKNWSERAKHLAEEIAY